ncbi:MAG: hypothetical protein WCC64_01460 [Aliidongia sp.]
MDLPIHVRKPMRNITDEEHRKIRKLLTHFYIDIIKVAFDDKATLLDLPHFIDDWIDNHVFREEKDSGMDLH